jgi:hypothetical protein
LKRSSKRHPLYPAGGYAAVEAIADHGATWRQLQRAQLGA